MLPQPVAVVCYSYDPVGCCCSYFPGSQHWHSFMLIPLQEEECSLSLYECIVLVPGGHGGKARPPLAVLDALAVIELYFVVGGGGGAHSSVPS